MRQNRRNKNENTGRSDKLRRAWVETMVSVIERSISSGISSVIRISAVSPSRLGNRATASSSRLFLLILCFFYTSPYLPIVGPDCSERTSYFDFSLRPFLLPVTAYYFSWWYDRFEFTHCWRQRDKGQSSWRFLYFEVKRKGSVTNFVNDRRNSSCNSKEIYTVW